MANIKQVRVFHVSFALLSYPVFICLTIFSYIKNRLELLIFPIRMLSKVGWKIFYSKRVPIVSNSICSGSFDFCRLEIFSGNFLVFYVTVNLEPPFSLFIFLTAQSQCSSVPWGPAGQLRWGTPFPRQAWHLDTRFLMPADLFLNISLTFKNITDNCFSFYRYKSISKLYSWVQFLTSFNTFSTYQGTWYFNKMLLFYYFGFHCPSISTCSCFHLGIASYFSRFFMNSRFLSFSKLWVNKSRIQNQYSHSTSFIYLIDKLYK